MSTSDIIALIGLIVTFLSIIINSYLAYWIVKNIQAKQTNQRFLKDFLISEILKIKEEYESEYGKWLSGETPPRGLTLTWLRGMKIKTNELIDLLDDKKNNIPFTQLKQYNPNLNEFLSENKDFIKQYGSAIKIEFSDKSKQDLLLFKQRHHNIFMKSIIEINDND